MELISSPEFLRWAAGHDIGYDPRYPRSDGLVFTAALDCWRPWHLPPDPSHLASFVGLALDVGLREQACWVYPRGGGRWFPGEGAPWLNDAMGVVARGARIPDGHVGAVRFEPGEFAAVAALAVASLVFGWGTGEDLYFVPADGSALLMTSHHRDMVAHFPTETALLAAEESVGLAAQDRSPLDPGTA